MPLSLRIIPLTYQPDSRHWFSAIRHLPDAAWLDSGHPGSTYGRFDILCAAPQSVISTRLGATTIAHAGGQCDVSQDDPFRLLDHLLFGDFGALSHTTHELPFIGGALGYFAYDMGRYVEKLPTSAQTDIDIPEMRLGIYPWAIVQDHQSHTAHLVLNETLAARAKNPYNFLEIEQICARHRENGRFHEATNYINNDNNLFIVNKFEANLNVNQYDKAIARIQDYIRAGDCYQVNFAQRFSADYEGDPWVAYQQLRAALPSPFSGFLQWDEGAVLSLSPERFIQVRDQVVETKPIKGTVKRGATAEEDQANAQWLKTSLKNRAENVMIVDLLRNDLSKHCQAVRVPALCELQTFANVHHLVSTVTGRLKAGSTAVNLLRDAFPGGSITGAPKIRAMEIIEELEPTRRSLYCGSLGYISLDGQMDTSIAIRTLVCTGHKIYCWGGGGIVADSEAEQEYRESIAKVKVLMDTLEQAFIPHHRQGGETPC